MDSDARQQHRRERLEKAADKAGGKAALGRLLGYKDGAFVGQMLRGERPVTEDTVEKLEAKPGFRDWFSIGAHAEQDVDLLPLRDGEADFLHALRLLENPADRDEIYSDLRQLVMQRRAPLLEAVKRLGVDKRADDQSVTRALGSIAKRPAQEAQMVGNVNVLREGKTEPMKESADARRRSHR